MAREEMVATFGLEDGPFQAGLKRVNRAAEMSARKMAQAWGAGAADGERRMGRSVSSMERGVTRFATKGISAMIGLGSATAIAARAMDEYAKKSDGAAASLGRLESARKRLLEGLGRDLTQAGIADGLAGAINGLETFRSGAVDRLTDLFGGDSKGLREAAALDEQVTANGRRLEALTALRRSSAIEQARANGDDALAERLSGEEAARAAVENAKRQGITGKDLDEVRQRTMQPYLARESKIRQEREREAERTASGQRTAGDDLGFAERIRIARQEGRDGDADRLEVERRFQRQRAGLIEREAQGEDRRTLTSELYAADVERLTALEEIARREKEAADAKREAVGLAASEVDFSTRALEIEAMRAKGLEKEADAAAARLEYEQRISDINRQENLSEAQKERFRTAAKSALDAALGGGPAMEERTRTLDIGLGARIQGQALGSGGSDAVSELKKQTGLLQKIADQGVPAVLG
jgi:hypothetical protein